MTQRGVRLGVTPRRSSPPRGNMVGIRLHVDDLAVLDALADRKGLSRSHLATTLVQLALDRERERLST